MSKQPIELKKFNPLITDALRDALLRRNETWKFLKTEHKANDAKAVLEDARDFGTKLSEEIVELVDYLKAHPKHAAQADALLDRYEAVNGYIREIQDCLNRDFEQKQKEAEARKFDWTKNILAALTIPGILITGVKNGVGNGRFSIEQALWSGLAISIPTVFHKNFKDFFTHAAQNACAVPQIIKNDIRVYYAREIFREKKHAAELCFATAGKAINDNAAKGMRATAKLGRIFARRGPQP